MTESSLKSVYPIAILAMLHNELQVGINFCLIASRHKFTERTLKEKWIHFDLRS